jgi:hypothetical protein
VLLIRREQLAVLERIPYSAYTERMVRYIAKEYPRQFQAMGQIGTGEFVMEAIQRGRRNHIETQGGIAVLIELMIAFGEDFQNSPHKDWANELLAHPTLPAQIKMRILRERMTVLSQGRVVVRFDG